LKRPDWPVLAADHAMCDRGLDHQRVHASVPKPGFDPATLLGDHRCVLLLPIGGIAVNGVVLGLDGVHDV
jgi:hypothetical protein